MNRRSFIKNSILGTAALVITPLPTEEAAGAIHTTIIKPFTIDPFVPDPKYYIPGFAHRNLTGNMMKWYNLGLIKPTDILSRLEGIEP